MASVSPSAIRIDTTSTLLCSPITVTQRAEAGDVVGVQMGVDRLDQPQIELLHQLEIAVDLLEHRIDDERLAAAAAGEDVAIGARDAVEQLAEDQSGLPAALARAA